MSNSRNYFNEVSYLLDRYVPSFVKDEYPLFYEFIETYYEWCQQNNKFVPWNILKNIQDWNDVDNTIDEFINYFKNEYINLPDTEDWQLYIKHYKEIYNSKGSTKSLKFFMKLLTGLDVSITYPNRYLMKSSDGIYRSYKIIYCDKDNNINYNEYISTQVSGATSGTTGTVEKIEIYDNYIKLYLSNVSGKGFVEENIKFNNGVAFNTRANLTITDIQIIDGGNNYQVDEEVILENNPNIKCKITNVKSGKLDEIQLVDGGSGYKVGDCLVFDCKRTNEYYSLPWVEVSEVDDKGVIRNIKLHYSGYGLLTVPNVISVISDSGIGAQFECISRDAGEINKIDITYPDLIVSSDISNIEILTEDGINANLAANTAVVVNELPYYYKSGSFLSDIFKLQDSYYYQEYSYVLNIAGNILDEFKEIFKTIIHPAGFIYFTNTILENYIKLNKEVIYNDLSIYDPGNNVEIEQYIELLHYYDRIINDNTIYNNKDKVIGDIKDKQIYKFARSGGWYSIRSDFEISTDKFIYDGNQKHAMNDIELSNVY